MSRPAEPTAAVLRLRGRVALVTGGAKRVGRAIALHLARHGMDVAITCRGSADAARQTVEQVGRLGRRAVAIQVDLARPDADGLIYTAFTKTFDRLDALVNNAAGFRPSPIEQLTPGDFDEHMAVNARAPLMLTHRFAAMLAAHFDPGVPATAGRVVNLIDSHVLGQPHPRHAAYNASKAALLEITRTAALELAPGVTVNAIAPGVVQWASSYDQAQRAKYLSRVPLGREGTPRDAADAALYFIADAHYCTGQVIRLDGGRSLT